VHVEGTKKKSPLAAAVRVPAFWGLVVAFAGYGLAFSAMSFHLIPLLDDRGVPIAVVMAIIALIGPMQVVGRVLLMAGQRHITTIQLGALIYFAFPVAMTMLALGISDVYGLILFAIIYRSQRPRHQSLRGMAVGARVSSDREGYGVVIRARSPLPTNLFACCRPVASRRSPGRGFGRLHARAVGLLSRHHAEIAAAVCFAAASVPCRTTPILGSAPQLAAASALSRSSSWRNSAAVGWRQSNGTCGGSGLTRTIGGVLARARRASAARSARQRYRPAPAGCTGPPSDRARAVRPRWSVRSGRRVRSGCEDWRACRLTLWLLPDVLPAGSWPVGDFPHTSISSSLATCRAR
jgi:hypothetical protein